MNRGLPTIRRRRSHALGILLLAAACGQGEEPRQTGTSAQAMRQAKSTPALQSITLITGDRVTLREIAGQLAPQLERGPGREEVTFSIEKSDDELTVIPSDVAELVGRGTLDPELFNVTRLLAEGYGDDQRATTPLLVTGLGHDPTTRGAAGLALARGALASAGLTVGRASPSLGMMAVQQDKGRDATALLAWAAASAPQGASGTKGASGAPPVKIWLDGKLRPQLDQSVAQIGAPAAYARGLTGAGVKVAIVDGGVDETHPDLAGRVVARETFIPDGTGPEDTDGHGTHLASIVAGSGAASGGQYHGVATGAQIISARVCNAIGCFISDVIAGMEWSVQQGAKVINLSLGRADTPGIDPLEQAVNTLAETHDVLFVAAAGNSAVSPVSSPSTAEAALSVGAVDRTDALAAFSSRGPRPGDRAVKPDLTAPGVDIVAARAAGTRMGSPVDASYTRASGTSMATPHVAGAAAILWQQHPSWTYAEVKAALMGAAQPNEALTAWQQGAGRVDLDRATAQTVAATTASLSFGMVSYPHDDDPVQTQTIRYRNEGPGPVTLSLAASLHAPGSATPPGMITVSPSTLQVPAGGTAETLVQVDTRGLTVTGPYQGAVIATSGETRVVTPLGVDLEGPSYDLKVVPLGRNGQTSHSFVSIRGLGPQGTPPRDFYLRSVYIDGPRAFHVPAGTYTVVSDSSTLLIAPRVEVQADTAVVMDGRLATLPELTLPDPDQELLFAAWEYSDLGNLYAYMLSAAYGIFRATAEIGAAAPPGEINSSTHFFYGRTDGSHVEYHLARSVPDHFASGWRQSFRADDFARVEANYLAQPGLLARPYITALPPRQALVLPVSWPRTGRTFRNTEYYYGEGYLWSTRAEEQTPYPEDPDSGLFATFNESVRALSPGQVLHKTWNLAPFGPGFYDLSTLTRMPNQDGSPVRRGNTILMQPSLVSGQGTPTPDGFGLATDGFARLYRDGELIDESWGFSDWLVNAPIPETPATYRFETSITRDPAIFLLSPHVEATWTFRTQGGPGETVLPLPTLRFAPTLDDQNKTSAPLMLLPLRIERPAGAATPRIAAASVEASFDDGAHWQRLPLLRLGDRAIALIAHPRGATYVSLRGSARDVEGNEVKQTIVHAYGLAERKL